MDWKKTRLAAAFACAAGLAVLPGAGQTNTSPNGKQNSPASVMDLIAQDFHRDVVQGVPTPQSRCVEASRRKNYVQDVRNLRLSLPAKEKEGARPIVIIDPGHGGLIGGKPQPGTLRGGFREIDIVDVMIEELARQMREAGMEVYMTRQPVRSGRYLTRDLHGVPGHRHYLRWESEAASRLAAIKGTNAVIFIGIHADHHPNPDYSGTDIYLQTDKDGIWPSSSPSLDLAQRVAESFRLREGAPVRIRHKDLAVLRCQPAAFASVLVELGQMNNDRDFAVLKKISKGTRSFPILPAPS